MTEDFEKKRIQYLSFRR